LEAKSFLNGTLMASSIDPEEIIVTIAHPHGDIEVSLGEWMRLGPGERPLVRPIAVRKKTGEPLSISDIPLRYRNTALSRALIKAGLIENPWKAGPR
jgi:hypothetical protein